MKWLIIACILAGGPVLGIALRRRKKAIAALVFALGFLIFFNEISIHAGTVAMYRGTDRGFVVSLFDCAAYVLYFAAPPAAFPAPFRAIRYAYLAVCVASAVLAPVPLYTAFSLWTLLRLYLMIGALHRAFQDRQLVPVLYQGLAWGVIYLLAVCIKQRYLQGLFQVHGTFAHQNSMGMAAYLVAAVIFPVVLSGEGRLLPIVAVASAAVVVVLSLSRGCLFSLPLVLGAIYARSIARQMNGRKAWISVAGLVAAVTALLKGFDSIVERFSSAPGRSAESRVIYEAIAARILHDHPVGVGLNQFSYMAGEGGYHRVAEELDASWVQPDALVHNVYWLTVVELGFVGLLIGLALIGQPIITALRGAWRFRDSLRGELLFGCCVGLTAFCVHGVLEWAARQERLLYLFWMVCVAAATLYRRSQQDARAPAQAVC